MKPMQLIDSVQCDLILERMALQLIEQFSHFQDMALIGIKPRGHFFSERIKQKLESLAGQTLHNYGTLDVTFHRDDFRRRDELLKPQTTEIPFLLENKHVILADDVLYTGRTIRAALDALLDYGRPASVSLIVLIDRRLSRHLPIEANIVGKTIDSINSQRVTVNWKQIHGIDEVILHGANE
jgi:pyrimidine operon attenuation protein/uracil phosphoribosyltransferase